MEGGGAAHSAVLEMKAHDTFIQSGSAVLEGRLVLPEKARGIVLFAHGSGSSRHSPRNQKVAKSLNERRFGTLLFDLLTPDEARDRSHVFDTELLAQRLLTATHAVRKRSETKGLRIAYFGASTGAAAVLVAETQANGEVSAIISRGGRPDLAFDSLPYVHAPTQLIVGGEDSQVLELNRSAYEMLRCEKNLEVVPGATHLFEEEGALDQVIEYAAAWLERYL